MYVLMDMEWVENLVGEQHPTQIAAMRVDEQWEEQALFSWRIQPTDESFHIWDHVGYTGGYANEFLSAPSAKEVFQMLQKWLEPEDVLCWWHTDSAEKFGKFAPKVNHPQKVLSVYLYEFFRNLPVMMGNPYRMLDKLGHRAPGIRHHSKSDVKAMQAALMHAQFPQRLLAQSSDCGLCVAEEDGYHTPYVKDVDHRVVHKRECPRIPEGAQLAMLRKLENYDEKFELCNCCNAEYLRIRREKNKTTILHSEYSFVYTPGSNLFHKRSCMLILNAKEILGTVYYKNCIATGRVPCQTCKPTKADETDKYIRSPGSRKKKKVVVPIVLPPKPRSEKTEPQKDKCALRSLTEREKRAVKRLLQAQSEREKLLHNNSLTPKEKADQMVLSQPRFAFWAAAGYGSFHLRHCNKLNALSDFRGFSLYEDAVRAGYQPCKQCKPSTKHNMNLSMPIYSRVRPEETVEMLESRCAEDGFTLTAERKTITLETPKGIWRIPVIEKPFRLEHINKVYHPSHRVDFHAQPKIFLSLMDIYTYIKKHDGPTPEDEWEEDME